MMSDRDLVPFEQNGHRFWDDMVDVSFYKQVNQNLDRDTTGSPEYPIKAALSLYSGCSYCGADAQVEFYENPERVVALNEPCILPDGITTMIDLAVPSGMIVVDDSLRPVFDSAESMNRMPHSYNTALGQAEVIEDMARQGCAFGPVWNTSPGLYFTRDGNWVIANPGYDWETGEETEVPGFKLAQITTDLWAYSIADRDDFLTRGGELGPYGPIVVDIGPGVYRFTHHTGERSFDRDALGAIVYADIEKVS